MMLDVDRAGTSGTLLEADANKVTPEIAKLKTEQITAPFKDFSAMKFLLFMMYTLGDAICYVNNIMHETVLFAPAPVRAEWTDFSLENQAFCHKSTDDLILFFFSPLHKEQIGYS